MLSPRPATPPVHAQTAQAPLRIEAIGLCRFSYPAIGGFQVDHATPSTRAQYLYAADRLDERFRLFETVTLPSLRAQTDQDFTLLVVIGQDLPAARQDQLRALLADLPQAVVQAHAPGRHRDVMAAAISAVRKPEHQISLQFRIDDDDAIGRSFIARLRETVQDTRAVFARTRRLAIDFTNGHILRASASGIHARAVKRTGWAPGLAVALRADAPRTVMNFAHHKLWQQMPTLSLPDPDMFVRGVNDHNDSEIPGASAVPLLEGSQEDLLRTAYGICADHVRRVYAGTASR